MALRHSWSDKPRCIFHIRKLHVSTLSKLYFYTRFQLFAENVNKNPKPRSLSSCWILTSIVNSLFSSCWKEYQNDPRIKREVNTHHIQILGGSCRAWALVVADSSPELIMTSYNRRGLEVKKMWEPGYSGGPVLYPNKKKAWGEFEWRL